LFIVKGNKLPWQNLPEKFGFSDARQYRILGEKARLKTPYPKRDPAR
jgi:hypothetical protein